MRATVEMLFLCVVFFVAGLGQQTIPMAVGNAGHMMVSVSINDTVGTFILDTGAGIHVVTPRFLRRISPRPIHAGFFTGFRHDGDRLDTELFQAKSLNIGGQVQVDPVVGLYPPLEQWGIDGLVSMKFFEERAFTIECARKQIRFESDSSLAAIEDRAELIHMVLHADRGVMLDLFVRLIVQDSIQILAEFDTGAGFETVLIHPLYLGRLGIDSAQVSAEMKSGQLGVATRMTVRAPVSSLEFAGSTATRATHVPVVFKEGLIYEGLIGSESFREKRLTIDIPNRRMLVW